MRRQTRDLLLTLCLWLSLGNGLALAALDPITNFAETTMSTGYDAAATSVIVAAGTGSKFPSSYTYPLVWWNCTDYNRASADPNVEIVSVTNRSGDTFTIARGQESTTAVAHNTAGKVYCFELNLTKGMWDRIQTTINGVGGGIADVVDCASYASCNDAVTAISSAVKTLRISNAQPVASNLTIPQNITVECTGSGVFQIATGVTLTGHSPEQFKCNPRAQIFSFTGTAALAFTNPGTVSIGWCGAIPNDGTDDSVAAKKCHDSMPSATNTGVLELLPGAYTWNSELVSATNGILIRMVGATLDMTGMTGSGRASIHASQNVLGAIVLTGSNQRVVGGRITGPNTVNTNKLAVGVLLIGAANARVSSMLGDGPYACVWAGNNTTDLVLANMDLSGCGYGGFLGFSSAPSDPQVTRATVLNVRAHGSTIGAGLLIESFARDVQVLGGYYYSNATHGLDVEVGGDRVQLIGVNSYSNSGHGLRIRYGSDTGETAGKWGYGRRSIVANNIFRNNTLDNVSIQLVDYSQFSTIGGIEEMSIEGNYSEGSGDDGYVIGCVRCTVKGNGAYRNQGEGFTFRSLRDTDISGNQAWDNGIAGDNRRGFKFTTAATTGSTPPNSTNVTLRGNHGGDTRSGGSRTTNFSFDLQKLDNSDVSGNIGTNANTADWINVNGLTAVSFFQNRGTVNSGETMGSVVAKHLSATGTYDPPNVTSGSQTSTTLAVSGAAVGDTVTCGHTTITADLWQISCYVSAADTVRVVLKNHSGGAIDAASGTLRADVWKH
ncbi:MAG: hypothetical protein H8K09_13130 [Nitrospira sp.]|nr:hypothetical protein [Nitrospira sp.]